MKLVTKNKAVTSLVGMCVSAVSIFIFIRKFPLHGLILPSNSREFLYLVLGILVLLGSLIVRVVGWVSVLKPIDESWPRIPTMTLLRQVVSIMGISSFLNLLLPARAGDVYRIAMIRRRGVAYGSALVTVLLEKVIDVLILFIAGLYFFGVENHAVSSILSRIPVMLITVIICAAALVVSRKFVVRAWYKFGFNRVRIEGLPVLVTSAIVFWILNLCALLLLMRCIGVHLSYSIVAVCLVATNLVLVIPSAPGGVGLYEYAMSFVLLSHGATRISAGTWAVSSHALQYIAFGAIALYSALMMLNVPSIVHSTSVWLIQKITNKDRRRTFDKSG